MLELGAYWAHYSMWLKQKFSGATCFMVEPDEKNLRCGQNNFLINGYKGEFIKAFVGRHGFAVDKFAADHGITSIDVLHSDVQGFEIEMLNCATNLLARNGVKYIFVSTHSEDLHSEVVRQLHNFAYRIEVSSGFDTHTTSCDGFVLASSPNIEPIFCKFRPLGRLDICGCSHAQLVKYLVETARDMT
jgi:hypothetical protein